MIGNKAATPTTANDVNGDSSQTQLPSVEELASSFDAHLLSETEVLQQFKADYNSSDPRNSAGLTTSEASARLSKYGPNKLTAPFQKSEWRRYFEKYLDRFIILLLLAGTLSIALSSADLLNLYLGIILYVVCIAACTLSFIEEGKVTSLMDTFHKMLPKNTNVFRQGNMRAIPAEELVVGDIVLLKAGDQVAADVRILFSNNIRVECSSLTGESEPIPLKTEAAEANTLSNEATNIAFSSSLVIDGDAVGVVVRTGDQTMLGRIADVATGVKRGKTTLQVEIDRLVNFISILALVMAITVFVISVAQGNPVIFSFVNGFVVIIIANVPQGLQLTVMVALNVSGRNLAAKNIFVKSLNTIETLGSSSCICTDKTGTLTQNTMTVAHLWDCEELVHARHLIEHHGHELRATERSRLAELLNIAAVCNKATYDCRSFTLCATQSVEQALLSNNAAMMAKIPRKASVTKPAEAIDESSAPNPTLATGTRTSGDIESQVGQLGVALSRENSIGSLRARAKLGDSIRNSSARMRSQRRRSSAAQITSPVKSLEEAGVGISGDASDIGLMQFCDMIHPVAATRARHNIIFELPFNSSNKYSACIIRPAAEDEDQRRVFWLKGAPEIVLSFCTTFVAGAGAAAGAVQNIDDNFNAKYDQMYRSIAKQGERVLGFAQCRLDLEQFPPDMDDKYEVGTERFPALTDLTFAGVISLIDPPRPGVKEAVAKCHDADVKVIMVTGDHPLTAEAIARKVGIISQFRTAEEVAADLGIPVDDVQMNLVGAIVVHGHDLADKTDAEWDLMLSHSEIVFARTTPQQKLDIVKHCQRVGEIVAVTGDGVNDAPALRQANIGIAMGTVGSDVSRNAADVVLITNDWSSIVTGIEEGRTIFDNLVKSIAYTLTHLWPEVFPSILALVFGFPFLISSLLVLMIDLGTEMFPAISLAYEKPEMGLMQRPPRDMAKDRLVSKSLLSYSYLQAGVVELCSALLGAFIVLWNYGIPLNSLPFSQYWDTDSPDLVVGDTVFSASEQIAVIRQVQAGYFIGLVGSQVFNIWACRSRFSSMFKIKSNNIVTVYGVVIEILALVLIVYFPFTQDFFKVANPPPLVWVTPLFFMVVVWSFVEVRKYYSHKYPNGVAARYLAW